jgi:hypothetical protein
VAAAAVIIALLGALGILLGASRAFGGRYGAATGYLALGAVLGAMALVLWRLAPDLASYRQTADGDALAELVFERTGPGRFRVTMTRLPEGRMTVFEMQGEEWRMQARSLGWIHGEWDPGIGSRLRLERLDGRYPDAATDTLKTPSAYSLGPQTRGDVWSAVQAGGAWLRILTAEPAESPWYPMVHRARLRLRLSGGALLAEGLNEAAAGTFPPLS